MEVDYIILVSHEEFIVIHARNEAPIGIYLERAEAADYIYGHRAVVKLFEFLGVVVIIDLHAVFIHGIFLSVAEHCAGVNAFLDRVVGCAADAYRLDSESMLKFDGIGELVALKILNADMAADRDETQLIELGFKLRRLGAEVAREFNAVITRGLDILESLKKAVFIVYVVSE